VLVPPLLMPLVPLPILLEAGIDLGFVVVVVRESGVNFGEGQGREE